MNRKNQIFDNKHPSSLHYIFGANCYQHAIGFDPILFHTEKINSSEYYIYYALLRPGIESLEGVRSTQNFNSALLKACEQDGIILTDSFNLRSNFRTVAIFSALIEGMNDFHFSYFNEQGKWEDKTPFQEATIHNALNDIEKRSLYRFICFGFVPLKLRPLMLDELNYEELLAPRGKEHQKLLILNKSSSNFESMRFAKFKISKDENEIRTQYKLTAPMPYMSPNMLK